MKSSGAWMWLALSAGSLSVLALACGHAPLAMPSAPRAALSPEIDRGADRANGQGQWPMLFPEYPGDALDVGAAGNGARRKVLGPLRFLVWPNGRLESSRDLLPAELVTAFRERPSMHAQYMQYSTWSDRWFELRASREEAPQVLVGHLPNDGERSGARVVIAAANKVWLANDWLTPLRSPYYDATARPVPGLDEVVMMPTAAQAYGLDVTSGVRGPIAGAPKGVFVSSFRAIDALRAIATFDLLGTCVTWDGGEHWHPLEISLNVFSAASTDAGVEVVGSIRWRKDQVKRDFKPHRYLLRPEGQWEELPDLDGSAGARSHEAARAESRRERTFRAEGASDRTELADWVERGGANERGEVFVLTKGDLLRVDLVNQRVISRVKGVLPADRECNAIRFGSREDVGFVCSSPSVTSIVRIDRDGALRHAQELKGARVVTAAGNGNVLTDGSCDGPGEPRKSVTASMAQESAKPPDLTRSFCLVSSSGARTLRFEHLRGDEKMIPMRSGEMWIVSPPTALVDGRLLRVKGDRSIETISLKFLGNEPKHALWLEPMEETEAGVSGWLDLGSVTTNVTVSGQGKVEIGTHSLNGSTEKKVLGGRFAIGWVGATAYETTNGGQSWWPILFPAAPAISGGEGVAGREMRRHCGALGCVANGWVRLGWNPTSVPVAEASESSPRVRTFAGVANPKLRVRCNLVKRENRAPTGELEAAPSALSSYLGIPSPIRAGYVGAQAAIEQHQMDLGRAWIWRSGTDTASFWKFAWRENGESARIYATASSRLPSDVHNMPVPVMTPHGAGVQPHYLRERTYEAVTVGDSGLLFVRTPQPRLFSFAHGAAIQEVLAPEGMTFDRIEGAVRSESGWYVMSARSDGETLARLWSVEGGERATPLAEFPRVSSYRASSMLVLRNGMPELFSMQGSYASIYGIDPATRSPQLKETVHVAEDLPHCPRGASTFDLPLGGNLPLLLGAPRNDELSGGVLRAGTYNGELCFAGGYGLNRGGAILASDNAPSPVDPHGVPFISYDETGRSLLSCSPPTLHPKL